MDRPEITLPSEDYSLTLASEGTSDLRVKRSRFLGFAAPTGDETAARSFIKAQEKRFHDARHVCYGWRLGWQDDLVEIRSDAGEPSGSAGEPILNALRKVDVADAVAVVVRYFGGVKLGTGGLARAYGEAADAAVARAGIRVVARGRLFDLDFPYPQRKTIAHILHRANGEVRAEEYGASIRWRVWLPNSRCEGFNAGIIESTAGGVQPIAVPPEDT